MSDQNNRENINPREKAALSKYTEIKGTRLHYLIKGQGRPIICLHGNPGFCGDWDIEEVPGHALYILDRPGHGLSTRYADNEQNHLDRQVDIIHDFIKEQGLIAESRDKVILAAHSWGGYLALAYALKYGADLAKLVLVGPLAFPRKRRRAKSSLVKLMRLPLIGDWLCKILAKFIGRKAIARVLAKGFAPAMIPEEYQAASAPYFYRPDIFRHMLEDKEAMEQTIHERSRQYKQITVPTTIIAGEQDSVAPPASQAILLSQTIPKAKLITISGAGHELPQTNKKLLAQLDWD